MQLHRQPDRLGRPPNCRWIIRRPPDPPPKEVFDRASFSNVSNDFRLYGRSQSSRSIVINRIQMKIPVDTSRRVGAMTHIYDSGDRSVSGKLHKFHFLPLNYF